MSFVLAWKIGFLIIAMADILSQHIIGSSIFCCKSESNLLSQIASHAASIAAMYSTSAEDKATIFCFFELQAITFDHDDAVKFTSEMHDPCAQTVTYKREENTNTLQKAPVWSQPNTLRRLSQKSSYNSRVLERGQLCVPWREEDVGAFIVVRSCLLSL